MCTVVYFFPETLTVDVSEAVPDCTDPSMDMSNPFSISNSYDTTFSPKQLIKTMPCIIYFPVVSSLLVIIYEVLVTAYRLSSEIRPI